jgi:hypothetical protein
VPKRTNIPYEHAPVCLFDANKLRQFKNFT